MTLATKVPQGLDEPLSECMMPQTGAELVDYWYECGVVGSRTDIDDAPLYARELRQEAEIRNFEYLDR